MCQQGEQIRADILKDFPLAFKSPNQDVASFAAVKPITIQVNEGAKPVNRSTCAKLPAGLEEKNVIS